MFYTLFIITAKSHCRDRRTCLSV